jgi:hypothetical protein
MFHFLLCYSKVFFSLPSSLVLSLIFLSRILFLFFTTKPSQRSQLVPLFAVIPVILFGTVPLVWVTLNQQGWPGQKFYLVKNALISYVPSLCGLSARAARASLDREIFPLMFTRGQQDSLTIYSHHLTTKLGGALADMRNLDPHLELMIAMALLNQPADTV